MNTFEQLIAQTAGNLYWKDLEGHYIGCNNNFAKILKLSSTSEIVGKTDFDLLDSEKASLIYETDKKIIEGKETITIEEKGLDINGKEAYYLSTKSPLFDENNNIIGIIGSSIDITKQKQAEQARSDFISNMEHDIRTPFNGICTISKILYEKEEDKTKKEWLGYVVQSSNWLFSFFNQILDIIVKGKIPSKIVEFKLQDSIDEVVGILLTEIKRKNLTLNIICSEEKIICDSFKLSRILLNLMSNAVRYTDSGKINLIVHSIKPLKISIEDTGIGIPKELLEFIFEEFSKLKLSNTQQIFSGLGVGLYLARYYARELGGDITVTSEPGKGSCFTLLLN
ncbi:MAG: Aerobic respiration control sensor protein ArcB [Legionellaceae bacterium]